MNSAPRSPCIPDHPLTRKSNFVSTGFDFLDCKLGGLNRYFSQPKSRGFVGEVKTNLNGNAHKVSKKQTRMFRLAEKMGFGVILVSVTLKENFIAQITLRNGDEKEFIF